MSINWSMSRLDGVYEYILSHLAVFDSWQPFGLQPTSLLLSTGFFRQEYWSRLPFSLFRGSFLHCRWILYLLSHQGSPDMLIHLSTILQPKGNELLIEATTWMNLRNILHKRSQLQKTIYCMIPFVLNVHNRQIYRDRK